MRSFPVGETGEKEKRAKGEKEETITSQKGSVPSLANEIQLAAKPPFADWRISPHKYTE